MAAPTFTIDYFIQGFRLINGMHLNKLIDLIWGVQKFTAGVNYNITAASGGGQANAFLMKSTRIHVSTVAIANDSVRLPVQASPGTIVRVINGAAANSMQVFGSGADTINGQPAATGVAQAAGITVEYQLMAPGKWFALKSA